MSLLARIGLLLVCASVAVPAEAQSTRARLDDLELRVAQLEQILQSQTLIEMSEKLEVQAAEIRALRGELELIQRQQDSQRKQQADIAADFEQRLGGLEKARAAAVALASESAPVSETIDGTLQPATPAEPPDALYGRAFEALRAARYAEAIEGMKAFLSAYPAHPLADNAQYWLGQTYYLARDYARAVEAFAAVGGRSPDRSKAPDALLKKGLSEIELGRLDDARRSLNEVQQRFPDTDSARSAANALQRLR
jgi:tol-pal system protein YbgF